MTDERYTEGEPEERFTPDTLPGAGPVYGPDQPYDPATPEPQNEQRPLRGEIPEEETLGRIREGLSQRSELNADGIEVTLEHGVVILNGTVGDDAARQVAEETAQSIPGVTAVDNNLRVETE